jgi:cobalt-zinc-cadmium efflux system outer membrane protein
MALVAVPTIFGLSPPEDSPAAAAPVAHGPVLLTLDEAVRYALERNPQLAALRQQHGIAAAAVVIARTYPFNPVYQGGVSAARNSDPGQVTNSSPQTHQLNFELQLFRQQSFRRSAACAALSRTDWEIAGQELAFAANAIRGFDGLLYRQGKLAVTEEFLRLNRQSVEQARKLVERGTLGPADVILARAEVNDVRAQVELNRTALLGAMRDYYRALGVAEGSVGATGTMERPPPQATTDQLLATAFATRPDRFAKVAAVQEADANVRLQQADRYGNPQIGPVYEINESRTRFVGVRVQIPIPLFNRKAGEIQQAKAQRQQAAGYVRQTEIEMQQDVSLAVSRVAEAQHWAESYRREILPALEKSLTDVEGLFQQGQAGVDVLRVLDVRRKVLRAKDGYLDALFAYTQALADLAQAVGDPGLAMGVYQRTGRASAPPPEQATAHGTTSTSGDDENRGR